MTGPKSQRQLTDAIEDLVDAYIGEIRRGAEAALEPAFARNATAKRTKRNRTSPVGKAKAATSTRTVRRSAEDLAELGEELYAQICAHPGESMTVFAQEMGISARELQRPMSKLKAEGRIRRVGERNLTRYFPSVGRRSRGSEA